LEGQLDESRAKVSSLEAESGEKRDETDKLRQEMDALSQTHRVSMYRVIIPVDHFYYLL